MLAEENGERCLLIFWFLVPGMGWTGPMQRHRLKEPTSGQWESSPSP